MTGDPLRLPGDPIPLFPTSSESGRIPSRDLPPRAAAEPWLEDGADPSVLQPSVRPGMVESYGRILLFGVALLGFYLFALICGVAIARAVEAMLGWSLGQ